MAKRVLDNFSSCFLTEVGISLVSFFVTLAPAVCKVRINWNFPYNDPFNILYKLYTITILLVCHVLRGNLMWLGVGCDFLVFCVAVVLFDFGKILEIDVSIAVYVASVTEEV